jgi:hypothetical protein
MNENRKNSWGELLGVAFLYLLATIVMTYPIAFRPGEHYSIHNDYLQGLWNFWWFKESIFHIGTNPYFSDFVFFPTGVGLAFHTLSITNAAIAVPILYVVDLVTAYNIVYLITFFLSGFGTYLLVNDLTGNRYTAFLSGLILAFCPYHFVKSYQIWAASLEWMPLFAFFFLRFLRSGGLKNATLSALMLFCASLSSWYLMAFTFLFIGFSIFYYLVVNRERILSLNFIHDFSFFAGLYGLLILPFAYPMIREVIFGESHMYTSLYAQFLKGSKGVVEGRTSSTFQLGVTQLFGIRLASPLFWPGLLGYVPIFLAVYGIVKGELKEKGLWIASLILFFLFLLGPYLTIFDRVYRTIPLPWLVLDKLPIFKAIRYPHRFMAPFMMCLSVLAGSGALALSRAMAGGNRQGKRNMASLMVTILSVLIMIEYFVVPVDRYEVNMSPFYSALSRDRAGEYGILEVPVMTPFTTQYMFFQTFHRKKIVGGQIVHPKEEVIDFLKTTPVIRELANPVLIEERGETITLPEASAKILADINIRYVLVHRDLLTPYSGVNPLQKGSSRWNRRALLPPFLNPIRDLIQESFFFTMRRKTAFEEDHSLDDLLRELEGQLGPPVYEDDQLVVYRV